MLCLAIHVYEKGKTQPAPSVRIPLAVVGTIAKFVPTSIMGKLKQHGVDVPQLVHDAGAQLAPGTLADITDGDDRIVIALEPWPATPPKPLPDDTSGG